MQVKTKVHPVRIFVIILYAYSRGIYSTRKIELAYQENIKFRFLLQNFKIPDHFTISRFLTKIEVLLLELFEQFFKIIFKMENISTNIIYIYGNKIETYANKYTFVWRESIEKMFKNKISIKF
ncbi:MAG: transposase [Fusobacterium sp.]|nr:transposase [Fusobacterium sp.]